VVVPRKHLEVSTKDPKCSEKEDSRDCSGSDILSNVNDDCAQYLLHREKHLDPPRGSRAGLAAERVALK